MKSGDHRRVQLIQQRQQVAAGGPAENSELMLDRDNVHVAGIQESGGAPVRAEVLLLNLEADNVRIVIAPFGVIDRHREAPALGMPCGHRAKQIGCKRGNAAFARQVVADKRDGSHAGSGFHQVGPMMTAHAALARVSPRDSGCPSRSAASWHRMQHGAHGTAARRLGLIGPPHSTQIPKLPPRIRPRAAFT